MAKSESIKVLMIGPGEGIGGGISTLIQNFLPGLMKKVPVFYIHSVSRRPLKYSGRFSFQNVLIAFSQYFRFLIALLRVRPNIIHLHTSQGIAWIKDTFFIIIGKAVLCQIVLHMHGGNFEKLYDNFPYILQLYTRWIFRLTDVVIAVSSEWKNRLARLIPVEKIFVLRNCIDIQGIRPKSSYPSADTVNILFLGRVGQQKGAFDLLDAIQQIKSKHLKIHVWMVGPEEVEGDNEYARTYLENHKLMDICELVGVVSKEKADQFYQNADIFVLPSHYEGLPMVVLEALAAGLPVVATPVGGIPEVVHDGYNGYLTPIRNPTNLASNLVNLINDAGTRKTMGLRSREIAEQMLSIEIYVEKLEKLYSQISTISSIASIN